MSVAKQVIEEECEKLVQHLDILTIDRNAIHDEFKHLSELQKNLVVQLRSDSFSGEGKLHAFQVEKTRIEVRLEELELQLKEKNDLVNELDCKASEYLLNVTTESNYICDEEEFSEQNEFHKDMVQKLVFDEIFESNRNECLTGEEDKYEKHSSTDEDCDTNDSLSITETYDNSKVSKEESDGCSSLQQSYSNEFLIKSSDGSISSTTPLENEQPTDEQMLSLSSLLIELKTVKDEMGKCITGKDHLSIDIEDQFMSTRQELSFLRDTMSKMTDTLRWKESVDSLYQSNDNLHEEMVTESDYSEEDDSLIRDELLSEALQNYSPYGEQNFTEKLIDDDDVLSRSRFPLPTKRSSSVSSSISTKVAMLECQLKNSSDKLTKSTKKIDYLLNDRNRKRYECEMLQEKVNKVESKMCKLQGTFDGLATTIAAERDDLLKKLSENFAYSQILENKLKCFQSNDATSNEKNLQGELKMYKALVSDFEKNVVQLECDKYNLAADLEQLIGDHDKSMDSVKADRTSVESTLLAKISEIQLERNSINEKLTSGDILNVKNKEAFEKNISELNLLLEAKNKYEIILTSDLVTAKHSVRDKELEIQEFEEKNASLQLEINDITSSFRDEIKRLHHECFQFEEYKKKIAQKLFLLGEDSSEIITKHDNKNSVGEETSKGMDIENFDIEILLKKIKDQKDTNFKLTSDLESKTNSYSQELNAREATIQELQITLTNNQKQSRENYQVLQDDMTALTAQSDKEKDESNVLVAHLKDKCLQLQNECQSKAEQYINNKMDYSLGNIDSSTDVTDTECVDNLMEITETIPSEEFEKYASQNDIIISSLQEKIYSLEKFIKSRSQTVDHLESNNEACDSKDCIEIPAPLSRFEAQLLEIKKLNDCLDTIKSVLETSANEFSTVKETIDVIHGENESLEDNRTVVIELDSDIDCPETQLNNAGDDYSEEKKNFVKAIQLKLKFISSTFSNLDFDNIVNESFDRLNSFTENNLINKRLLKDKLKYFTENTEIEYENVNYIDINSKLDILEKENSNLIKEKLQIIGDYKLERVKTIEMENQMVSDLEFLVLNLESEKKELISSLLLAQEKMHTLSEAYLITQQQDDRPVELELINNKMSQLELEKNNLILSKQQCEEEFFQKIAHFSSNHKEEMTTLKNDMREEIDIIEQQKDEILENFKDKIINLNNDWTNKINYSKNEYELQIKEDNARFGRILVEKNNEYEKLCEEKQVEVLGYQVRLADMQTQLGEKVNLLEELETNMEEVLVVRDNLEEKLFTLQHPKQNYVSCPMLSKESTSTTNEQTENSDQTSSSTT